MSGKSKLATNLTEFLEWLPADHVAKVDYGRDPHGREVLTVEGMTATILMKHDPLNQPYLDEYERRHPYLDAYSQRRMILASSARGLDEFRVILAEAPTITNFDELLIRGYFSKHLRFSQAKAIEVV